MKAILFILILFSLSTKSQTLSIPDTDTGWSLQDVHDVVADWNQIIGDHPPGKLDSLFIGAEYFTSILGSLFDSRYEGSHNSLLNFRNYAGGGGITPPTVTTSAVTYYSATSSNGGGNVTSLGSSATVIRGVVWSTSTNPTTTSNIGLLSASTSATGAYAYNMGSLTAGTTYYVRAFATNNGGTSYGDNVSWVQGGTCRPSGLTGVILWDYMLVSGNPVLVTLDNACSLTNNSYYSGTYDGDGTLAEGSDLYLWTGATDCQKIPNGVYMMQIVGSVVPWSAVQVIGGKLYYIPC